jgi:hypothetical protein
MDDEQLDFFSGVALKERPGQPREHVSLPKMSGELCSPAWHGTISPERSVPSVTTPAAAPWTVIAPLPRVSETMASAAAVDGRGEHRRERARSTRPRSLATLLMAVEREDSMTSACECNIYRR